MTPIDILMMGRAGPLAASGPPLTNLVAWYRKGVGITDAGGGAVSAWADQSGNGNNVAQSTAGNRPTLQGDGTILFDGAGDGLIKTFTLIQPETVYMRFKLVAGAANKSIFSGGAGDTGNVYLKNDVGNGYPPIQFAGSNGAQGAAFSTSAWTSIAAVFNGASSAMQFGGNTYTGNPGAGNMGGINIGANSGNNNTANIYVAEVLVYNVAHDATTRATVIAYLDTL